MILETAEIAAKSAQEKAALIKERSRRMQESRYEVAIALALLARCNGYLQLGCKTIGEFAETKAGLEYRDWTQMLSVGRRALQFPEVDVAFRSGALNWSRSEEHTSELQSQSNLVCRLLLEKKKKKIETYDK